VHVHRFETPGLAQYAYLIASQGHAAVLDPIRNIEPYLDYARDHRLTITHVLETHIHADFASGATALAAATGAELAVSAYDRGELYEYSMPHRALHTGDSILIGDLRLEALHTPGHTPEHLSFLLFPDTPQERPSRPVGRGGANQLLFADTPKELSSRPEAAHLPPQRRDPQFEPAPTAVFSGDFLFVGSLGRPDLLGEAAAFALARDLYRSVHDRIAALPGSVRVYPGHGAGSFCGAGMSDAAESTLAAERLTNPLFQLDEPAFLAHILGSVPPMPAYYPRMKQLNAAGPPILAELSGNRALTPAEVAALAAAGNPLLDLRDPTAFAAAHIPGSLNIGLGGNISLWAGWLLDPGSNIVLIAADTTGSETSAATRALLNVGLDKIAGHLTAGFPAWLDAGLPIATTPLLTPANLGHNRTLLDVRNPSEFLAAHIPGAQNISLGSLQHHLDQLPDGPITLVCEGGYRASIAASLLARHGFKNLSVLNGGMEAWHRDRLKTTSP
jgi:hydroxyacylglutathione hydrolase